MNIKFKFIIIFIIICNNIFASNEYVVKEGDTLYSISKKNNISVDDIIQMNGILDITSIPVGTTLKLANEDEVVHIVRKDDTLFSISRKYNISLLKIMEYNNLKEGDIISIGQNLIISNNEFLLGSKLENIAEIKSSDDTLWPVDGEIEEYNGRIKGLQITVGPSQDIKSVSSGKVVWYDSYKGIGKVVLISGDNGFDYLYGTVEPLNVKLGNDISKGEKLGRLNNSEKLIFSVFKNGKPVEYTSSGLR